MMCILRFSGLSLVLTASRMGEFGDAYDFVGFIRRVVFGKALVPQISLALDDEAPWTSAMCGRSVQCGKS